MTMPNVVSEVKDPANLGRVQIHLSAHAGGAKEWARVVTPLRPRFASRTQMNVSRPLIVKKRESGYGSVEFNRRAPATDPRRPADPTSRMDQAKWRMPRM